MTRSLMSYLPYVLRDYTEIQAILVGQQPELDQVWEAAESLLENQFIVSAEGLGLGRWEKILGITPKGTDSLEDRRFRILARWNEELPYTIKQLRAILETLCGAGNYTAEMDGAYTLSVKVGLAAKSSFADVQAMLERITPQNLVLALSQLYNTWNEAKKIHLEPGKNHDLENHERGGAARVTYTENYRLKKPDGEDFIDIEDLNQNMEAIDAQLKAQAQKAEGDGTKVQEVQAALKQKADLKNGKVPAEQLPEMDYIASADRGAPGGVATLGSDGKVPEGQLPAMNYDPKGTAGAAVSNHNSSAGAHADIRQAVANTQAAAQQAASALQSGLDSHTGNKDNPHAVTKEQIGLGQADNTSDADKPISKAAQKALDQLSDDLEQVAGMTLLGGGAGGGELEDTALEAGSFVNAGAGWNTVRFREAFEGVPHVVCQVENLDCTIQIKDITAEGFLYCLRILSTGSYYTGASTGTQPSHSATTLVSGTTTTATAVKIHYIAVEYGGER